MHARPARDQAASCGRARIRRRRLAAAAAAAAVARAWAERHARQAPTKWLGLNAGLSHPVPLQVALAPETAAGSGAGRDGHARHGEA
eukprot:360339-Chlamydomonas_euryale.AAC.16